MALRIKSAEAHLLAKRLAELTGQSMAKAVTETLRLRVEEIRQEEAEKAASQKANFGIK